MSWQRHYCDRNHCFVSQSNIDSELIDWSVKSVHTPDLCKTDMESVVMVVFTHTGLVIFEVEYCKNLNIQFQAMNIVLFQFLAYRNKIFQCKAQKSKYFLIISIHEGKMSEALYLNLIMYSYIHFMFIQKQDQLLVDCCL